MDNLPKTRKEAKTIGSHRFYTGKHCKLGHDCPRYTSDGRCIECSKLRQKRPDKIAHNTKWRRLYRESDTKRYLAQYLMTTFRLSVDDYMALLVKQNYACAICAKPFERYLMETGKKRDACVDHCHVTHEIRGILCDFCNNGIGRFYENRSHLANAITYLM